MAGKLRKKTTSAGANRSSKTAKTKSSPPAQSRIKKSASRSTTANVKKKKVVVTRTRKNVSTHKHALTGRTRTLRKILIERRGKLLRDIQDQLGQSLTQEQQRRFESAMDSGDQALLDLEREMGISLQEKRNRERQMIDEALVSLEEGSYGVCVECDAEISEKRLMVMPFTRVCVACQEKIELFEKIERGEQRA